ncbi:hypothetical protein [Arthrobacter bambusae]|uniref:hypothetical protein n=1 Tax=Arthrobacter bambusae TaxID=1338426 RepID=UPI002786C376|nr:hypothetical protein [Arthrobacter bambusae]MDQ0241274.1 hypothetical protein [Arthrobacter bambusae]
MANQAVNSERMMIALGKIQGFPFEAFVNDFFGSLLGKEFTPLGGVKDGGADGFERYISEDSSGKSFIQASVRMDVEDKVRQTIARLKEFGRTPTSLIYVTSKPVKAVDALEDKLTNDLDVTIRIRDGNYLISHANDGIGTQAAYNQHLRHLTESLDHIGSSTVVTASKHVRDPSVFVFLSQELERRDDTGNQTLVADVVDSLIMWALEETDPEKNMLMTEPEILARILNVLPSVENLVKPRLPKRLTALSTKSRRDGRAIRRYKSTGQYCLPFDTRQLLRQENQSDEALRTSVEASIEERITAARPAGLGDVGVASAVIVTVRSLQLTFEHQGLTFISSLQSDEPTELVVVADSLAAALDEAGINGQRRKLIGDVAFECLRGVLYESTPEERDYLHKLSRTYALLFTLNSEPKLVDFFQQMAGDFYLYVGSDQLVRALSEICLDEADKVVTNTLKMSAQAGAKLVLTESALDEIVYHLRGCDNEFQNTFAPIENFVTYELARNSPKIMVRAYMYSRLGKMRSGPTSWQGFISQFCTYADLHKPQAFIALRRYLQNEFSMIFKDRIELRDLVDAKQLEELTATLEEDGYKKFELAENDALMVLSVYGHRRKNREHSNISEFGYQTWWLTGETRVLRHTGQIVSKNAGGKYVMRPDFLLNFLTLAPAAHQARETFSSIFPSLLGVTLSRRMAEAPFKKMLGFVREAESLNDSRRMAVIAEYSDKMKSDLHRQYLTVESDAGQQFAGIDALAEQRWDVNG